jgi:hypothetical protein
MLRHNLEQAPLVTYLYDMRFPTCIAVELDLRTELDDLAARERISRSRLAETLLREAVAARKQQPVRAEEAAQ